MDSLTIQSCIHQLSIWIHLIEKGKVKDPLVRTADYLQGLVSLRERLQQKANESAGKDDTEEELLLHFVMRASTSSAKDGLSNLRSWLKDANEVVICDPYFFHFNRSDLYPTEESYAKEIAKLLPVGAKRVDIYSNGYKRSVRNCLMKKIKDARNVRHFSSHRIHDRFVIKDGRKAKVIGTSFGGFGRKFSVMVDLPDDEVGLLISQLIELRPKPSRATV